MARPEKPVNVPTSTARRAPIAETRMRRNVAWSGAICITACGPRRAVSSRSSRTTSSSGERCASR